MAKKKTTIYVDEEVLRDARIAAARAGKRDYEIVEEALKSYLGSGVLERIWSRTGLTDDEAMRLAVDEVHRFRPV